MRVLAALLIFGSLTACTDADGAKRALEAAGYRNIQITGYSWFGCGQNEEVSTGFSATGHNGASVTGAVCTHLIGKGNTIRTD